MSEKLYIIPTEIWLKQLEPYMISLSTKEILIIKQMANKKRIVVKITKNIDLKRIKNINYLVRRLPNFPKIYFVFECNEDINNSNINIVLEIMKLYKHKLSDLTNKLNIEEVKSILKQLIFSLIMAFESTGFIHGDLHIENILLNELKETKILEYQIENIKFNIETDIECIIMDFDKSITYDNKYMHLPDFDNSYTLIKSIINIINICGSLYLKEKKYEIDIIRDNLNKSYRELHYDVVLHSVSILGSFYSNSRDYDEFIKLSVHDTIQFINIFWKKLYDEYLFTSHTVEYYSRIKKK